MFKKLCMKENYDFQGADIKDPVSANSFMDCVALCSDQAGCVSITHQPATSHCWLKNKEFGNNPEELNGVNSGNLKCGLGKMFIR